MTKAQQIAKCVEIVAKYHNLDPTKVYQSFSSAHPPMRRSRCMIWYHLHDCGMSFDSIARLFRLSYDAVQRSTRQGSISFTEEERLLISTLPRIQSTLRLTQL
jgi:hypothetical protein